MRGVWWGDCRKNSRLKHIVYEVKCGRDTTQEEKNILQAFIKHKERKLLQEEAI